MFHSLFTFVKCRKASIFPFLLGILQMTGWFNLFSNLSSFVSQFNIDSYVY